MPTITHTSLNTYNMLALYYGLKAAWERGYRDVICYSDSTLPVQLVSNMVNPLHHYAAIISNVQDLLQRSWNVQLKHSVRETNSSADFIAKLGAASSDIWREFLEPPEGLLPLLQADARREMHY